jgi:hypothetical protein
MNIDEQVQKAEEQINQAASYAFSKGYKVVDDCWGSVEHGKYCCLMGAMLIYDLGEFPICGNVLELIYSKTLPIFGSRLSFWDFCTGFQTSEENDSGNHWYDLGKKFRKKFNPDKYFKYPNLTTGEWGPIKS